MAYYFALIEKDQNSAYGISFPDLPGCFSAADRFEDIVPNAIEALELWAEDADAMPEGRAIHAVGEEARAALRDGAFLMGIPLVRSEGKPVRVNVSIDRGVLAAIDEAAARRKLTRSAFLVEAARRELETA